MTALFTTKSEIVQFLDKYHPISKYTIRDDLTVDIEGNIYLVGNEWDNLPITFGIVTGDFSCSRNKLKSLKGCPTEVHGDFMCSENELISLQYGPSVVGKDYYCYENQLQTLEFIPKNIGGDLIARDNLLNTLVGGPEKINGKLYFENNQVSSFEGVANYVGKFIQCSNNPIACLDKLKGIFTELYFSHEKAQIPDIEEFVEAPADGMFSITHHRLQSFLLYRRLLGLCEKPTQQTVKI